MTPNYWVNPENRINYVLAVQTPPDRITTVDALMSTPIINGIGAARPVPRFRPTHPGAPARAIRAADRRQPHSSPSSLSNISHLHRSVSEAAVSHYNVQPVFEVFADVQGRDLGGVVGGRAAGHRLRCGRICRAAARSPSAARSRA